MTETKSFDTRAIASITTGILLIENFSLVHEAIEWIVGHPVWTHELPSMSEKITDDILRQHPEMPVEFQGDWRQFAGQVVDRFGSEIAIEHGIDQRTSSPIETLETMIGRTQDIIVVTHNLAESRADV